MKKITARAAPLLLAMAPAFGQGAEDITGRWSGVLTPATSNLDIIRTRSRRA